MPIGEGDLGLTGRNSIKDAAYIVCHALILGRVVAASARGNLQSLFQRLPERPIASAFVEKLKTVAAEVKSSQLTRGCSWRFVGSPGGGRVLSRKRERDSTGRSGSRGSRGARGRENGGVKRREQWEDPLTTQPGGENEMS